VPPAHFQPRNDLAGLGELTAELVWEVYANRAGPQAAAFLRLLTPGTSFMYWPRPTAQFLTNVLTLVPSNHIFQRVTDISLNRNDQPTSKWVKTFVD
jgi:hypothetical protein